MSEILTVGGVVFVGRPDTKRRSALHVGRHVGWFPAPGIRTWTKEVSVVKKSAITPQLQKELGVTLPEEAARARGLADTVKAAESCSLVAVTTELAPTLIAKGLRVYSIGCDRITGGIYFFADGGSEGPMRLQGDLISMVAPNLPDGATNNEIEDVVESVIDRLVSQLSAGLLNELEVELAEALPKLGEENPLETLQTFEGYMLLGKSRSEKYAAQGAAIAKALETARKGGHASAKIELFEEAFSETQAPLALSMNAAGADNVIKLPARTRWITTHELAPSIRPPAVAPAAAPAVAAAPVADAVAAEAKRKTEQEAARREAANEAAAEAKAAEAKAAEAKRAQEEAARVAAEAAAKAREEARLAAEAKAAEETRLAAEAKAAADAKAVEEAKTAAEASKAAGAAKNKADAAATAAAKKLHVEEDAADAKLDAEKALAKAGDKTAVKVRPRADSSANLTLPTSKFPTTYILVGVALALVILYFLRGN